MRYAIISDIHANLEAFQAVLAMIADLKVDKTLCLGDITGYNANPNECIEIIRRENIVCIMGNHDSRTCGLESPGNVNALAKRAILWTSEQLTPANREFIASLPRELKLEAFFLFHGSIHSTDSYIFTKHDLKENFALLETLEGSPHIGFFGHTHMKVLFSFRDDVLAVDLPEAHTVTELNRYLINPGSVGQPRDGDSRASFLVYDTRESNVTFHRVDYNINEAQRKIISAGLPAKLAERLSRGW